jgi:hypothetical protein
MEQPRAAWTMGPGLAPIRREPPALLLRLREPGRATDAGWKKSSKGRPVVAATGTDGWWTEPVAEIDVLTKLSLLYREPLASRFPAAPWRLYVPVKTRCHQSLVLFALL